MNEWIKCSDRLPEVDGRYLVVERYSTPWIGVARFDHGKFGAPTSHWMPMPILPETEVKG